MGPFGVYGFFRVYGALRVYGTFGLYVSLWVVWDPFWVYGAL
jgi:hypothetical protein